MCLHKTYFSFIEKQEVSWSIAVQMTFNFGVEMSVAIPISKYKSNFEVWKCTTTMQDGGY